MGVGPADKHQWFESQGSRTESLVTNVSLARINDNGKVPSEPVRLRNERRRTPRLLCFAVWNVILPEDGPLEKAALRY